MKIAENFKKIFFPSEEPTHHFTLPANNEVVPNNNKVADEVDDVKEIFPSIDVNIDYIKVKYNLLINSDIMLREFILTARNKQYRAFLLFIDGMVDIDLVNNYVLKPLMLKNSANSFEGNQNQVVSEAVTNNITVRKVKKFDIKEYIYNSLLPQNNVKIRSKFEDVFNGVNSGNCALFIDTLNIAFDIEVKGFNQRGIDKPSNEIVVKGPHQAFVENIRTNTSMIRRVVNNENLVIENIQVGEVTKTYCALCYMANITNEDLIAEVKYRLNNLEIDSLLSSRTVRAINCKSIYSSCTTDLIY